MKRSVLIAWLFMLVGALIYLIGLWRACPLLSGKGYFLGVLITSMFIIYVYQREVKRGLLDVQPLSGGDHCTLSRIGQKRRSGLAEAMGFVILLLRPAEV